MDKILNLKWKKEYIAMIILISFLVLGGLYWINLNNNQEEMEIDEINIREKTMKKVDKVKVEIKGQVLNPGVYEMSSNDIINDIINKSGGLTIDADTSYLNKARKLKDEMVIIIYSKDEIEEFKKDNVTVVSLEKCVCPKIQNDGCLKESEVVNNKKENNSKQDLNRIININTAPIEELETLTGIGPSKAYDIIKYREDNGLFKTVEELKEVKGIGESIYNKIKSRITI